MPSPPLFTSNPLPFGMLMPNRHENSSQYRYGFQGSEKDDEIKGQGNSYTTHYRLLDPRIGRWFSLDPAMIDFPELSPYNYSFNNPIYWNDVNGDCPNGDCNENNLNKAEDLVSSLFTEETPNNNESVKNIAEQLRTSINDIYSQQVDSEGNSMLNSVDHITFENLALDILEEKVSLDRFAPEVGQAFNDAISNAGSISERADIIAARSYEVYRRDQLFSLEGLILDAYATSAASVSVAFSSTPKRLKPFNYTRLYTHAQSQALDRGVTTSWIDDAFANPLKISKVKYDGAGRPSVHYIGRKATVVVNPQTGKQITTWKTSSKLAARLLKSIQR